MVRFRIEEVDGRPVIWPTNADLAFLNASVGDLLVLDSSVFTTQSMTDNVEHQIKVGSALMDQHHETFAALANA